MRSGPHAVRRAESFDEVAELYAAARPAYPAELVADLLRVAELRQVRRALEVGAGTGQLTVSLAEQPFDLVALERGPNLARLLSDIVAPFSNITTLVADFNGWDCPAAQYDLVIVATAFHWLDPATRVQKCARILRPGGTLAVVHTHWASGELEDSFARESQKCYARWDPDYDPSFKPRGPGDLPTRNVELENSGLFDEVVLQRYFYRRDYDAAAYRDLLATFSNILGFDRRRREAFLACIFDVIETRFGGRISRTDVYDLWLARTFDSAPD